jgi:hypothetical protein
MSDGARSRFAKPKEDMATAGPAQSAPPPAAADAFDLLRYVKFAVGVLGIFYFYGTLYADGQKALTSEQEPVGGETEKTRFTNTGFVLLVQCTGNAAFSLLMHFVTVYVFNTCTRQEALAAATALAKKNGKQQPPQDLQPFWEVLVSQNAILCAAGYVFAMYSSNKALEFVSYPLQILAKSCKMIPVMLGGILINKKEYKLVEKLAVVLMTVGVIYFSFLEPGYNIIMLCI